MFNRIAGRTTATCSIPAEVHGNDDTASARIAARQDDPFGSRSVPRGCKSRWFHEEALRGVWPEDIVSK
jgi:hypothetical protein